MSDGETQVASRYNIIPDLHPIDGDWYDVFGDLATFQEIQEGWEHFWSQQEVARFVYEKMPDGSEVLVDTIRTDKDRERPISHFDEVNKRRSANTRKD